MPEGLISELGGLVNVGAGAILVFVIGLLLTGRLLSQSVHNRIVAILQATIDEQREQLKAQRETVNPAVQRLLDSLPVKPEPPGKG